MALEYGTGANGASNVGPQARTDFYFKKALIKVRDIQYFMPLADVRAMPKHHGKTIKQDVYHPLLDDLNIRNLSANLHSYCKNKNIRALHFACKLIGLV